jgi:enoyl-CoA hydratase
LNKIRVEVEQRVALLTLTDPERRNAIDLEMTDELVAAIGELEAREDVGAVVITGEGSSFCAGAVLGAIEAADGKAFRRIYEAFMCVARCELPTIAAVNGPAVGAGMNLALACDLRIAGRSARFISRFLKLGLHPGGGHTWMLTRVVGPQVAAAMVLYGQELRGEEAVQKGLAWSCVEDEELLDSARALASAAADVPRELSIRGKQTLATVRAIDDHGAALEVELEAQAWSVTQAFYGQRVAALKRQITSSPQSQ